MQDSMSSEEVLAHSINLIRFASVTFNSSAVPALTSEENTYFISKHAQIVKYRRFLRTDTILYEILWVGSGA